MYFNKQINKYLKSISILLIVSLCFSSFSAIVADNDGSAFVTKTEFENLKEDFKSKIDTYQDSIDGKIDGAIASYLAGIRTVANVTQTNLVQSVESFLGNGKYVYWSSPSETNCTNYSEFLVTAMYQFVHKDAVGSITRGYASSRDNYDNGYSTMMYDDDKNINRCIKYMPKLQYDITYIRMGISGTSWSANLSSWGNLTHYGHNQEYSDSIYFVGYMNNTTEITEGALSGRSVSISYKQSYKNDDFVMCPTSSKKVSIYDPNNKDDSSSDYPQGSSSRYPRNLVYESPITGGTNASTTVMTSVQTDVLQTPDTQIALPWVSTGSELKELVLNLGGLSPDPRAMKYGLPLATVTDSGEFTMVANAEKGAIGLYVGSAKEFHDIPEKQKLNITKAGAVKLSVTVNKGDTVWLIYLPLKKHRLTFDATYVVKEA